MNNDAIGVFDSGIGGLTTVKALNKILPNENIIYFGDTARIPYGTKSRETVVKYAHQDIEFLLNHGVKMIIAACGTVSSVVGNKSSINGVPFSGVLLPAVQTACSATRNGKVGVIGTPATIKSGAYGRAIKNINPHITIYGKACPMFVPLVENGYTDRNNQVTRIIAEEYLTPIKNEGVDTLIMGCTHYPIIEDIIRDIMGDHVRLISPGEEAGKFAEMCLTEKDLLSERSEPGENQFFVSDSVELFEENVKLFLGHEIKGKATCVTVG